MFVDLMNRHDIDVYAAGREIVADGRTYQPGEAYVIPVEQVQYTMLRSVFDQPTEFEENIFYDVSGWTLPLAFDLEFAPLNTINPEMLGEQVRAGPLARPAPPVSSYGYVLRWSDYYAPRALYRLLDEEIRVRVATQNSTINTHEGLIEFGPGTVFVPFMGQDASRQDIHALVSTIAEEDGVAVYTAVSGSTPDNTPDLGDGSGFRSVDRPEVLVLFGDGLARYDTGEIWHQLDHRMHMPVTLRRKSDLGGIDWSRYTHLVIVGGNADLGGAQERVEQWVREEGGTIIAMRASARRVQRDFLMGENARSGGASDRDAPVERRDYARMSTDDAEHVIGGAIFEGDIDTSHPLGFGYSDRFIPLHRNTTLTLTRPDRDPFAVVVEYADDPLLAGYASQRRQDEIGGTPAVIAQRLGRGSVILFADNPTFRATFRGTERMFMNAVFYSGLINRSFGDY